MNLDLHDVRVVELVEFNADLVQVATGFQFTEGPIWHPQQQSLIFSDIINSALYQWSYAKGVTLFRSPSHRANGNAYDHDGRILSCEHATSRVTRANGTGDVEVLATHFEGKELNSPNDIVVHQSGAIYFTDPPYGRTARFGIEREQELEIQGVYRLDPTTNELTLLADDFYTPNGLCFSLDQRQLLVNDTELRHIRIFDVEDDGTLANGRLFAETIGNGPGKPDGMKIDQQGNVYCCGPGGIHLFDPDGICLGVVQMPERTTNFVFGDTDLCSLYITATTSIYRLRTKIPGHPTFLGC